MNRTKKFFYNSLTEACLQIITMLAGLIIPRLMLKVYGSEINGLVTSISQFISYFNLLSAGVSGAAVFSLYEPLAKKDYETVSGVVSATKDYYIKAGYFFTAFSVILAIAYPLYIKSDFIMPFDMALLVLVLGINGALEFFTMAKYRVLLTADQKSYVISIASIIQIVLSTTLVFVLANAGVNIVLLKFIASFAIFLRSALLYLYCRKKYLQVNYKAQPIKEALNRKNDVLYLQILGVVQSGLPVILLTLLLKDLKLVSVYSIYNIVIVGLSGILGIFISGLSASFGEIIAKKEAQVLKKAYSEFEFSYYIIITVCYSIAFVCIMPFIKLYTANISDVNYNLPIVGFLFVLNGLMNNVKTPQGMLVMSAGMYRETRWRTTAQAAILLVFGVVFTVLWGISGVLIAAILSNLYRDIDLLFFVPKKITGTAVLTSFKRILRIFLCVAISCGVFYFIDIKTANYWQWLALALICGAWTLTVTFLINFLSDSKEMKNVFVRLKGLIKK